MDGKRRWLGWIAIGLAAAALLVAVFGRGFGAQIGAVGRSDASAQQQNVQPQGGPGANSQPGAGQQNAQPGAGRRDAGPQDSPSNAGGEARRDGGRQAGGFGMGGGLHFPFRLIGGSFQWVMLALLIGLGMWMLRGRNSAAASTGGRAEPAQAPTQAPLSPTGEAYIDESSDPE